MERAESGRGLFKGTTSKFVWGVRKPRKITYIFIGTLPGFELGNIKLKLSLYLTKHHAMKTYGGVEVYARWR
jgi:hypothetical protein